MNSVHTLYKQWIIVENQKKNVLFVKIKDQITKQTRQWKFRRKFEMENLFIQNVLQIDIDRMCGIQFEQAI